MTMDHLMLLQLEQNHFHSKHSLELEVLLVALQDEMVSLSLRHLRKEFHCSNDDITQKS